MLTDVLVVGAGSSGMAAALELTRQGVSVVLIDAASEANRESRGTGLQPRTLELLELYGLADELVAAGNRINGWTSFVHGAEVGRIDFWRAHSRFRAAPALPQARTEGVLRSALARQGVEVRWRHRLHSIEHNGEGVVAHIETPDGPVSLTAAYVVGADGARSSLRGLMGLEFEGVSYPEVWGLLDVTLHSDIPVDEVRVYRLDGPQQFVLVPLGGTDFRVQLDHRPPELAGVHPTLAEMQDAFTRFTGNAGKLSDPTWSSAFNIHRRQVTAYGRGRVLLVGDAAHIHTPAGAQGLNTGIQDGINLGWKLGLVASGAAGPELLETYEAERRPIAAAVLELAEVIARRPQALMGEQSPPPDVLADRVGQLLVSYRDGPLGQPSRGHGGPGAGDRLPDFEVDGESVYRRLGPGRVVVAIVGDAAEAEEAEGAFSKYGHLVDVWRRGASDALSQAVGLSSGVAVIRPDAYLGAIFDGSVPDAAAGADHWLKSRLYLRSREQAELATWTGDPLREG
jgi:2-polyprenyl-6-methoxyphenol hydroxylase-like FAD-dependent oxidoreductase